MAVACPNAMQPHVHTNTHKYTHKGKQARRRIRARNLWAASAYTLLFSSLFRIFVHSVLPITLRPGVAEPSCRRRRLCAGQRDVGVRASAPAPRQSCHPPPRWGRVKARDNPFIHAWSPRQAKESTHQAVDGTTLQSESVQDRIVHPAWIVHVELSNGTRITLPIHSQKDGCAPLL